MAKATLTNLKAWLPLAEEALASAEERLDNADTEDNTTRVDIWQSLVNTIEEAISDLDGLK